MSNDRQKRPDPRDMIARAPPERKAELAAELSRPDVQRALQKGEGGLDAELAAQLAPQLGNDAVKEMMLSSTATSTLAASVKGVDGAKQEQVEEKGEERDEELESEVDQEVESQSSLPSFSGPTGAAGASPWSMGRFFGGDGDDDAAHAGVVPGRWRPMPSLAEPEDQPEGSGESADPAESSKDEEWLAEAYRELGKPPWRSSFLTKGLRDPVKMCRPYFAPESLEEGVDSAFGRARASLRLLAEHAETPAARRLAWTLCGAGAAVAPASMGYSGATARALHGLDAVLLLLPNRNDWERLLEVRLTPNARALTEHHADLLEVGTLGAVRLFRSIVQAGGLQSSVPEVEDRPSPHPAAIAALELASGMQPMPKVDPWIWELPSVDDALENAAMNAAMSAADSVLLAFTGGPEPTADTGVTRAHLGPLFTSLNSLLDTLGLAQVEIAAAAIASLSGGVSPQHALAAITDADDALVRMARRLVRAGRAIEARVGTTDIEAITVLSWEAVAVREGAELARRSALAELATHIACVTVPVLADPELAEVSQQLADGNVRAASSCRDLALLFGVALRTGRPHVATALLLHETFLPLSISLSLRIALGLLGGVPVSTLSQQLSVEAEGQLSAFGFAEAAISLTTTADGDVFEPLRRAAVGLRKRKRTDAIRLLVARWGELRLTTLSANGGPCD